MQVVVCPLNWGMGHATRMVPVIREQLALGNEVTLGADGNALAFLRKEFPQLPFFVFPDFRKVIYSSFLPAWLVIALQIPSFLLSIRKEHIFIKIYIQEHLTDLIISDNRYGVHYKNIHSVIVTHQLMLKMPRFFNFMEKLVHKLIKRLLKPFDECWIPDNENEPNYSGDLSHKYPICEKTKFIGILSRFQNFKSISKEKKIYPKIVALLSGPEPQRTILEKKIIKEFKGIGKEILIVRGLPGSNNEPAVLENISFLNHLDANGLYDILKNAEIIICRSGYSSIMDLVSLSKKAIIIPTDGQTEQEYLADYLSKKYGFVTVKLHALTSNIL